HLKGKDNARHLLLLATEARFTRAPDREAELRCILAAAVKCLPSRYVRKPLCGNERLKTWRNIAPDLSISVDVGFCQNGTIYCPALVLQSDEETAMAERTADVQAHWTRPGVLARIDAALTELGHDPQNLN